MSNSLNLELPYLEGSQSQKHVTVNDAFRRIDSIVQLTVEDRHRTSPPGSPQEGDRHIIAANPTGPWSGHPFEVASYLDGVWTFFQPHDGWLAFSRSEDALVYFDGSAWQIFTAVGAAETAAKFGVNTTANNTERLSVESEYSVFSWDRTQAVPTGDAHVVVNKQASLDTASHLFQRNGSDRAELGLVGSNDFSLAVTTNGSDWNDVFSVTPNNGILNFATMPRVGGQDALLLSFASRTTAAAASIPSGVKHIEVRGYSAENDGGHARYERVGSLPGDGLGFADGSGGFWSLAGEGVTARQAGAKGDGSTDDTAALQRAIDSGRNVFVETGDYRITNQISSATAYQRIIGDGRGRTNFEVNTSFNMSAAGVFRVNHPYVTLQDFSVKFSQAGVSSRATLIQYPPAVHMSDKTRVRLTALRFESAYDGVRANGNVGGAILEDIECGSFNVGFRFGGALDTVELRNCRVWPYEFAGNSTLYGIYSDSETIAFRIGQVDDLKMTNITPFRAKIIFEGTVNSEGHLEVPFGTIQGLALDGYNSSIIMNAGEIAISSLYATTNIANDTFITMNGGMLALSDFNFEANSLSNVPMVHVNNNAAICLVQNGRCIFGQTPNAEGFRVTSGKLTVSSVRFVLNGNLSRTNPCIRQIGGQLTAYGNTVNGPAVGVTGPFIQVESNSDNVVFGNHSSGWAINLPANKSNGVYGLNHNGTTVLS